MAGIVAGLVLIATAIFMGGGVGMFINPPSMLIVIGGTLAATMVNFPLKEVVGVSKVAVQAFSTSEERPTAMIDQLIKLTATAKKDGMLALEEAANEVQNPLLKTGLGYITDGLTIEEVDNGLRLQMIAIHGRHKVGQDVFKAMGKWSPAFGMIGTLIGLVQMLASMEDPASIGPKMAVALLTTFYGALLSNLVFLPIAGKLARRSEIELVTGRLILEGLNGIQSGFSPMLMEGRLKAFLQTERQNTVGASEPKGSGPGQPKPKATATV